MLLQDLHFTAIGPPNPRGLRKVPRLPGRTKIFDFDENDIARLEDSTAFLNDVCINSTASMLQQLWQRPSEIHEQNSQRCAIFSTFDLPAIRYNITQQDMWRRTKDLQYWNKDIWILPIHRKKPLHWVLCIIVVNSRELLLFDSLGSKESWKHEIKVSLVPITHM